MCVFHFTSIFYNFSVSVQQLAFFNLYFPGRRFGRFGKPHVIPGVDSEVILPSRHDVDGRELVIEETVCQSLPGSLDRITFGNHVVQPVVFLLIWRRRPGDCHRSRHVLLQLHRAWRLGVVCTAGRNGYPGIFID